MIDDISYSQKVHKKYVEEHPDYFACGKWKFKFPQNGLFRYYCGNCKHFQFKEQIGCAQLGECTKYNETMDAYEPYRGCHEKR